MKIPKREPKLYKWTDNNGNEREHYDDGEPFKPVSYGTSILEDIFVAMLTGYCLYITITAIL